MRRKKTTADQNRELTMKLNSLQKQFDKIYDMLHNEVLVNRRLSSELGQKNLQVERLTGEIESLKRIQQTTERVAEGAVRFKVVENLIQPLEKRIAALEAKQ